MAIELGKLVAQVIKALLLIVGVSAIAAAALTLSMTQHRSSQLYYVVFDSCGYQLSRDIIERYPDLSGTIINIAEISSLNSSRGSAILLYTNASLPVDLSNLPSYLEHGELTAIITDLLTDKFPSRDRIAASEISSEAIIKYCVEEDEGSLNYVATKIREAMRADLPVPVSPILMALLGVAALAGAALSQKADDIADKIRYPLTKVLGTVIFLILGTLYRRPEEVINNSSARKAILEYVSRQGAVRFSQLLKELNMPRGSIEWHLFLLVKFGLLREIRIGRRRYIVSSANKEKAIESLVKLCPEAKCVHEEISKASPTLIEKELGAIQSKCGVDAGELVELLEVLR